jgi:glyoxylase-like metal-dependent hydrolase (beta-lactamase superfamily II)
LTVGAAVDTLFNTHWHREQVGANAAFRQRGAEICAHRKTFAHLSIPYFLPDEDRYQQPMPPAAHPTATFFTSGAREIAGSRLSFGYLLEAHTDGDIYVHFEDDNVIAAGDAISPLRDPVFDWYGGGWLGGRIESLELLLTRSDADTRFVPSYGPTVDRGYIESEHELMTGLYEILWARVRSGESAEDILRSGALDALPRRFDDPMRLLYDCHKGMWAHYNTLSPDIV